jgi:hypothetical protein
VNGVYIQGEQTPNGLPASHTGTIDQLNAVIAGQLSAIMSPDNDYHHHHHHHGGYGQ